MPLKTRQALEHSRQFGARRIPMLRPLGWLAAGAKDLWRCPLPGLLHGLVLTLIGMGLLAVGYNRFWLLSGAFSGFLVVAPVLATGLYAVSRALERDEPATVATALRAWCPRDGRLIVFGLLLGFAGTGWVMTSASLITGFAGVPVPNPQAFLRHVVLNEQSHLFEAWLALGGVLAAPVFASSVITLPLLLDRRVGILTAVFTSWRMVMEHPLPFALWAALILITTLIGMCCLMLGLIVVLPLLAHASWHAYRDVVDTSALPEQPEDA